MAQMKLRSLYNWLGGLFAGSMRWEMFLRKSKDLMDVTKNISIKELKAVVVIAGDISAAIQVCGKQGLWQ